MHILVTNDDGPPSAHASPYVHCLIRHLQNAGHMVSVCLPHTQRSWIGKAHMIGQTLKPLYYRPPEILHGDDAVGTTHEKPSRSSELEEWVLVDGTPASCVQIGLHHYFQDRGPIDLVVSGPNYGRNTTAVFALSSGTLGAAMEAAVCRYRAIALSFAFFTRNHDPDVIEAACRHSVRVIDALYKQWPTDGSVNLYSVNVPLIEGVEEQKTIFTEMLQNFWQQGSCFEEIEGEAGEAHLEEESIREGKGGEVDPAKRAVGNGTLHKHKHFKWAPNFADVHKSVEESGTGNDGWTIRQGQTSVTPLKTNFAGALDASASRELELKPRSTAEKNNLPLRPTVTRDKGKTSIEAVVAYDDPYVQPLILAAMSAVFPKGFLRVTDQLPKTDGSFSLGGFLSSPESKVLCITPYEDIDFDFAASNSRSCLINSYMIRKALIRKHYLSTTVDHWVAKNPDSILKTHVKRSEAFEVDFAEFLEDALIEAFDLRESMDRNAQVEDPGQREWWILKPGMSDRGQGIRLFSTMGELQGIFDRWEEDQPDTDDEDQGAVDGRDESADESRDFITTSHLRHFVAQPYIHPPLLTKRDKRKFHIRTYVLCSGSMKVYVYRHMLALFAAKPYAPPHQSADIETFLTNTCLQSSPEDANSVHRFWDLDLPAEQLEGVFAQVCGVAGDMFEGAARSLPIHFQTAPNAFEVFGLDFLVDAAGDAWLLEVNAFPDFKQTGGDLREVVRRFWEGVMRFAVAPFFGVQEDTLDGQVGEKEMVLAREVNLGRG